MMKKLVVTITMITLFHFFAKSQEDETIVKVDKMYEVQLPLLAIKCLDVNGRIGNDTPMVLIKKRAIFYVLEANDNGSVLVQFWYEGVKSFDTTVGPDRDWEYKANNRYTFLISRKNFEERTRRYYPARLGSGTSITGGITVLPFKLRPRVKINNEKYGFDFSKDIQLGISGGVKHRISNYDPFFINAIINIGISSVTMDNFNTRGAIPQNLDIAALTYAAGLVLDFSKIQLGLFAGKDFVSDRNRNNWIYQGKTWWSIGFGYSIFNVSTKPIGSAKDK